MQQPRKTLSIRPSQGDAAKEPDAIVLLTQAIHKRLCVRATYNRGLVLLAPHILFMRDEAPFVDAVVVERDGAPPREAKLGSYRLSGLKGLSMTLEAFQPFAAFDPADERYKEGTLAVLG